MFHMFVVYKHIYGPRFRKMRNAAGQETKDQYKKQREQFRKHTMKRKDLAPLLS